MKTAILVIGWCGSVHSIVGRGAIKHADFARASGEMTDDEFQQFLETTLGNAARVTFQTIIRP